MRLSFILENAVENHFTAKPQRTERTYRKNKNHRLSETLVHLAFETNPCVSLRLSGLAVDV